MADQILNIEKVVGSLPTTLTNNTFYAVRVGSGYDLYLSDATGKTAHRINYDSWISLTTVQDLNNLTDSGKYFIQIGSNINAPVNNFLYVIVENATYNGNSRIIQTCYSDVDVDKVYIRTKPGANWKAWKTYDSSYSTMKVGGRNLLMATAKLTNYYYWIFSKHASQIQTEIPRTNEVITLGNGNSNGSYWTQYYQRSDYNTVLQELQSGKEYTISFEARSSVTTANYIRIFLRQYYTGGANHTFRTFTPSSANTWESFSFSFTLQEKHAQHLYWQFVFEITSNVVGQVEFRNAKLELGNTRTQWSPAYEDIYINQIGGRNLLLNSSPNISNSNYLYQFQLTKAPNVGDVFSVTLWGEMGSDRTGIGIYNTQGFTEITKLIKVADGLYMGTGRWALPMNGTTPRTPNNTHLNVYFYPNTSTSVNRIDKIKMEIGAFNTDYSVAPEEYESKIADLTARIVALENKSSAEVVQ